MNIKLHSFMVEEVGEGNFNDIVLQIHTYIFHSHYPKWTEHQKSIHQLLTTQILLVMTTADIQSVTI